MGMGPGRKGLGPRPKYPGNVKLCDSPGRAGGLPKTIRGDKFFSLFSIGLERKEVERILDF
jgi:hypothetical protein